MNQAINLEVRFFLTSVIWGVILLCMYDMLRIFRRVLHKSEILVAIEDVVFWAISSVLIFRMMYRMNNGVIRGFSIVGMLLGMVIYKYTLSEPFVTWVSIALIAVIRFAKKVIQVFLTPLRFFEKQCKRFGKFLLKKGKRAKEGIVFRLKTKYKALRKGLQDKKKRGKMKDNECKRVREGEGKNSDRKSKRKKRGKEKKRKEKRLRSNSKRGELKV